MRFLWGELIVKRNYKCVEIKKFVAHSTHTAIVQVLTQNTLNL